MPTRSTQVFVHNETNQVLLKTQESIDAGEWGRDGEQRPPQEIIPGSTSEVGSDSAGILTGTEASVRYTIGFSGASVYMHWNNPYEGSNAYHQFTDAAYDVFRTGGDGANAVVHFYLRPSELRTARAFLPSREGFRFGNHWGDVPYSLPPLRGSNLDLKWGNAADGLCGGMVFTVRDYFDSDLRIPQVETAPPNEEDPLFVYLVDRLFAGFDIGTVSLMLKLMLPSYPDTDENILGAIGIARGRAYVMAEIEWPLIRADIDAGRPSPMFLQMIKSYLPFDLGKNHQVLAYAYQVRGSEVELHVYDPNQPRSDDVRVSFSTRTTAEPIDVRHSVAVKDENGQRRPIYSFARMNYTHRVPPGPHVPRDQPAPFAYVSLAVETELISETVVESGRKLFPILGGKCGEREFDFERVELRERNVFTATVVGFPGATLQWWVEGVAVPAAPYQLAVNAWADGYGDDDEDADLKQVTITATPEGYRLVLENTPTDGNYILSVQVATAGDGAGRATIAAGFTGLRLTVPGKSEADAACMSDALDELRTEYDEEAWMADTLAWITAGLPPPEIHDPEYTRLRDEWADTIRGADEARAARIRAGAGVARTLEAIDRQLAKDVARSVELALDLPADSILRKTIG